MWEIYPDFSPEGLVLVTGLGF
ncbi:hypothetical protein F383_35960 [Gossypium arboreum]|uniref:Uncharacterized protein n=1 Tax=Gossypium arboreum TaxID=29729 RepID=A0A0B0PYR1_GOSAR|nr:hypothetical protein F383_35960 [Gossypium arboreum]